MLVGPSAAQELHEPQGWLPPMNKGMGPPAVCHDTTARFGFGEDAYNTVPILEYLPRSDPTLVPFKAAQPRCGQRHDESGGVQSQFET